MLISLDSPLPEFRAKLTGRQTQAQEQSYIIGPDGPLVQFSKRGAFEFFP